MPQIKEGLVVFFLYVCYVADIYKPQIKFVSQKHLFQCLRDNLNLCVLKLNVVSKYIYLKTWLLTLRDGKED